MPMSDGTFRVREEEVAAKVIDGEAIIINLATGMYYSLTGTGGEAWALLESGRTLSEIAEHLSRRYGVPLGQAREDVERLAGDLIAEKLVEVRAAPGPVGATGAATSAEGTAGPYAAPVLEAYRDMADLLALDPPMPGLQATGWQAPAVNADPGARS
jgi:hypothetical protein